MQINRIFETVYIFGAKICYGKKADGAIWGAAAHHLPRCDTLSLAGIPIYTEKGNGGGIGLLQDFVLNKSVLSEQDEILSALHGLLAV